MTRSSRTPASTSFSASRSTAWAGRETRGPRIVGDDAEAALVVAALGDLEVAVVARGQVHGRGRQQVDEGVGGRRHRGVDGVEHRLVLVRAGDGEHARVGAADVGLVGAEAAGDDDPAVRGERLADRLEALGLGRVEEAAGVDDDRLGAGVVGRDGVALGAQAGQDALAVDQRLRAAEADHADARLAGPGRLGEAEAGARSGRRSGGLSGIARAYIAGGASCKAGRALDADFTAGRRSRRSSPTAGRW